MPLTTRREDRPDASAGPPLRPFVIGPYRFANNLVLAPMAGVSDRPYRALCRRFGAALAVSEMVSCDTSLRGSVKSVRRLDFAGESGPVSVQILGTDPGAMAEAARVNLGHGAQIIDINMGCPARKVCRVAAGSALLRDELLVGRILSAVVQAASPAPVTLKIRTGWSPGERNALAVARLARECGVAALAVHGRTRACNYATPAEHETLRHLRLQVDIPLIANGDIDSPQAARRVLDSTGCDAIMIGRAAQGRPWIFRDIAAYLATGASPTEPPRDWIRDLLLEHLTGLYDFYGTWAGVRIARKHIAWYCRGLPGAAAFRDSVNRSDSTLDQRRKVMAFFNEHPAREDEAA
ncbi:tRNA dihydrouridine synthase DusB [uncultured Thiodictyon sp.]|jgi:tRNA-dihydrouridine synthase B|uniref:tRNA dihydrouridine synthase DusB n=1 Tax=uncultured Thiodictyon sp. TaxID=1846217 RepID=UPI0025FB66A0|nr:tRNA dihydrouridine synthase DusB [uncultured Thiodictyon sp.]